MLLGVFLIRLLRFLQASFMHWRAYRAQEKSARALRAASANSSRDIISRLAPAKKLRIEPSLGRNSNAQEPRLALPELEEELEEDEAPRMSRTSRMTLPKPLPCG